MTYNRARLNRHDRTQKFVERYRVRYDKGRRRNRDQAASYFRRVPNKVPSLHLYEVQSDRSRDDH